MYGRNFYDDVQVCALAQPVDLLGLHRSSPQRYPFLLQSTAAGPPLGRYDVLFAAPGEFLECDGHGHLRGSHAEGARGFLAALDDWWRTERRSGTAPRLPFHGGWFVYLGYELAAEIEPVLKLAADDTLPAALAVRCRAAIIHDHVDRQSWFVAEAGAGLAPEKVMDDIGRATAASADLPWRCPVPASTTVEEDDERFLQAVRRAKEYIAAGDIYQANLSRGWTKSVGELDTNAIYAALCQSNPAPFAGLARWKNTAIISSSPERLLKIRDGIVSTRPIAGTRPRSGPSAASTAVSSAIRKRLPRFAGWRRNSSSARAAEYSSSRTRSRAPRRTSSPNVRPRVCSSPSAAASKHVGAVSGTGIDSRPSHTTPTMSCTSAAAA